MILREGVSFSQTDAMRKDIEKNTGAEDRNGEGGNKNIFVRARKAPQAIPVGLGKAADKARAEMG